MPYKMPVNAPYRPLPAGQPQLGFDPVTIAATVASWASKIKGIGGLFKSNGPDWAGTAQRVITQYMNGWTGTVEGSSMKPRQFIEYYAQNANSATGRSVYASALQAINDWDKQNGSTSIFGPSTPNADGSPSQAGMSPLMMFVLAGAVVGGIVLMKRRK